MNRVLDACAMIAYLRGEPGGAVVDGFLNTPTDTCYAHAINLLEVYYDFIRKHSEPIAGKALEDLAAAGITERRDINPTFMNSNNFSASELLLRRSNSTLFT